MGNAGPRHCGAPLIFPALPLRSIRLFLAWLAADALLYARPGCLGCLRSRFCLWCDHGPSKVPGHGLDPGPPTPLPWTPSILPWTTPAVCQGGARIARVPEAGCASFPLAFRGAWMPGSLRPGVPRVVQRLWLQTQPLGNGACRLSGSPCRLWIQCPLGATRRAAPPLHYQTWPSKWRAMGFGCLNLEAPAFLCRFCRNGHHKGPCGEGKTARFIGAHFPRLGVPLLRHP